MSSLKQIIFPLLPSNLPQPVIEHEKEKEKEKEAISLSLSFFF